MKKFRDIVAAAKNAFKNLNPHTLKDTFLSIQKHMECSMMVDGGNNFKDLYMNKSKRRNCEEDIEHFVCSEEEYNIAIEKLEQSK